MRPVISVGATGPDVALAQQKLNAVSGAGAALPIDAIFSPLMLALVIAFQIGKGIVPTGTIDAATWRELDRAAPGGGLRPEGGTNVEQHVVNPAGASPLGRPIAGSSLHAPVGPGGITRGVAVREFQQKLNVWRAAQGQPAIGEDGRWGDGTRTATLAFQGATPGLAASGIGDVPTWTALDAIAPIVNVGFIERQWREEVGGHTYGMTNAGRGGSRYSWEIKTGEILVTTKVNFTGATPPTAWFGHVTRTWNRYRAVRQGTNEVLNINFRMIRGTGPDSRSVNVVAPPATGRANAGTWFAADTAAAETVPHEFGHLIGLRDEYQLHPGDFREITGREPDVGTTVGPAGVTPLTIATNLRAAMMVRNSANALAAVAGVTAGAFAQQIVAQYATLPAATVPAVVGPPALPAVPLTGNLVRDLDASLPNDNDRYNTIQVLTYTSGSLMGDPGRAPDTHDHGVQPRHVQEFVDILAAVERRQLASRASMTITYQRTDGRGEPPEHERLTINDDGTFEMWRSTGTPAVGRFGGRLPADDAAAFEARAAEGRDAGSPGVDQPPGSSLEVIDVGGGVAAYLGFGDVPAGPWGELVTLLRTIADARVDAPVAAVRLDIGPKGETARLVHAGTEPIGIELDQLTIEAVAWKGYYDLAGKWQRGPLAVEAPDATAGPGWAVDLPFDHDLELGAGRTLHVRVTFALDDGGTVRRVLAAHVPAIPEPRRRR